MLYKRDFLNNKIMAKGIRNKANFYINEKA